MKKATFSKFPALGYACAEAVNTLCTNLSFSGENVRKIMITSSHVSEGKSFTSINIMRTWAQLGKRVALVDADLRRSNLNKRYGVRFEGNHRHADGLAHYLSGQATIEDVVYETNIENAYIVPTGTIVPNPLPLFNSPRFLELLDYLAEHCDYVLVDAAPVGMVIDAAQVAKSCDGTLIVVNYNSVRRQELIEVKDQLEKTGCPILGTVMNMVEYDSYLGRKYYKSYYSKYSHYYRYSSDESESEDNKPPRKDPRPRG